MNHKLTQLVLFLKGKYPDNHRLQIILNNVELFNNKIDKSSLILKFDISSIPNKNKIMLNLKSSTFKLPGSSRKVGICIKGIKLFRDYHEHSQQEKDDLVYTRFQDKEPWFKQEELIIGELLSDARSIGRIHFTGGEPLINPMVGKVIDFLINKGVSQDVFLSFNSNFTRVSEDFLKKLANFNTVHFSLSIDATGKTYEFIRYPAKWRRLKENLFKSKKYKYIKLSGVPVVQIYNALDITNLCKFFDDLEIHYEFVILQWPGWLKLSVMPKKGRQVVSDRLRTYAGSRCPQHSRKHILSLADIVDNIPDESNQNTLKKFMLFTNDLDVRNKQNIKEYLPELYQLIAETGFIWTTETRYAPQKNWDLHW